jgi:NADH:ubiquinone oxidoreductase subunit F (NADH-binding)
MTDILRALDDAGLTGRGGAAFNTATKIRAARERGADLVVNACDGEIGAAKDAYVVAEHLDEVRRGADLVGARHVRWAAHRGSRTAARVRAARLHLLEVPGRYVSSEESSLVRLAHGGPARPVTKRAPIVHGARDPGGRRLAPTLVLNAETVWRIAQIEALGPAWFRAFGTPDEPGPRLVTVGGAVARPGVVGTEAGVPVADIVATAGGPSEEAAAVGVGGLGGGWMSWSSAMGCRWSAVDLGPHGLSLGPGVLDVLSARVCPLDHVARLLEVAAGESAGQCGPCMFGVPDLAARVRALALGRVTPSDVDRLEGRLGILPGRGACHFPDGVSRFTASALRVFRDEVRAHLVGSCVASPTGRRSRVVTV